MPKHTPAPTSPEPSGLARLFGANRPAFSPLTLKFMVAAFLLATANFTYWARLADYLADRPALVPVGGFLALMANLFCIAVFTLPGLVRPVLALALILGAVASHFQQQLGVVIDRDMLQNAMNTTGNESRHLLTLRFFADLAIFGLIPAGFVLWSRAKPMRWWLHILNYPLAIALPLALFFGALMTDYKTFSSMLRERRDITATVVPAAAITAGVSFAELKLTTRNLVAAPIGEDARKGARIAKAGKPSLTLMVVGETGRAANWSLGSYGRPTTPELAKRDIVYLDKVRSCGTSTATSMPCMFAHYGMASHSETKARSHQNLLDIFNKTGFDVQWIDNNTGSLGIAARIPERRISAADDTAACASGECTDQAFLTLFDQILANITRDTVIVYHQIGSHGPAYYLRYPESFRPFPDDCRSADFGKCTPAQITNAYDNTIAFTDLFLASLIDKMAADDKVAASMLYVSDHGESLGENGLYLHAAPYFMAPDVQTQVPMVLWTSPAYRAAMGLDQACIKANVAARPDAPNQDLVFHTLLGLADVTTSLHNPALDLTTGCHG